MPLNEVIGYLSGDIVVLTEPCHFATAVSVLCPWCSSPGAGRSPVPEPLFRRSWRWHRALAKALVYQRRNQRILARASFDSARVVLRYRVRRHPDDDPFYHAMFGLALAGLEDSEDAVREGEKAEALLSYPAGGIESTLMPAN